MGERLCHCHRHPVDVGMTTCWECRAEGVDGAPPPAEEVLVRDAKGGSRTARFVAALRRHREPVSYTELCRELWGEAWSLGSQVDARLKAVAHRAKALLLDGETLQCRAGTYWLERDEEEAPEDTTARCLRLAETQVRLGELFLRLHCPQNAVKFAKSAEGLLLAVQAEVGKA